MKKMFKKSISFLMIMVLAVHFFSPIMAYAVSYEDGDEITVGGSCIFFGDGLFRCSNGDVTIKKNNIGVNNDTFSVQQGDQITITMNANDNYRGKLSINGQEKSLNEGSYSFTIGNATDSNITITPSFEEEEVTHVVTYDFRLNGKDFTNVGNGGTLNVDDNFNFEEIDEFYIKNIYIDGTLTYSYANNEYSYNLLDNQGRHIFEINSSNISSNYIKLRIQSHPGDILNTDLQQAKANYYEFYIPEINIKKSGFKGVEITTNAMPDSYDFTTWNGVDLADTSESNPGKVTVYYGEETINFTSDDIEEITLVPNEGVPENVISIDNATHKVTVLSNYYNLIPLKIKLTDGTVGYVNVERIGIFIGSLNQGVKEFYHGASSDVGENLDVDTDKDRIVAVFYHENTKPGMDYKLIVNITYEDGSTETKIAEYVGDIDNSSGDLIGSDYILWKGTENMPVKVSAIAIDAEALTDSDVFGGATFGSGEGVIWERD